MNRSDTITSTPSYYSRLKGKVFQFARDITLSLQLLKCINSPFHLNKIEWCRLVVREGATRGRGGLFKWVASSLSASSIITLKRGRQRRCGSRTFFYSILLIRIVHLIIMCESKWLMVFAISDAAGMGAPFLFSSSDGDC